MLGPPRLSSPFLMMLRECLWRSAGVAVELERVRCLSECSDCWWASVRARRSELRCSARSSADGGSPKMKNLMKKKMISAIENWPSRKPCVNDSLQRVSGGRSAATSWHLR